MTGIHIVKKRLASGLIRWNIYAWRGGPRIHHQDGTKPVVTPEIIALALAAKALANAKEPSDQFDFIIKSYRGSPEFERLATSTRQDYNLWLDRLSEEFGKAPIAAFEDHRMRREVIEWRDQWRDQPRSADKASVMASTLLAWAVNNAMLTINVASKIEKLHKVDKSEQIWEQRHWDMMADAPAPLMQALKLASLTGLRRGDLIKLNWSDVGEKAIIVTTQKRKGRAVIPIFPELRELLDSLGPKTGTVLKSSRGTPWAGDGLGTAFGRAKPPEFDRTMHDLRGTYVTWLATKGLNDEEIARIVGWTAKQVSEIRARYVDEARVIVSIVDRLSA
ncbi:MAG: tyrosine-type recombinase/integrase [Pseudomonadota bacterium]